MKLVIDRARWIRGTMDSFLLRHDGKMCCLGFLSRAVGLPEAEIRHRLTPVSLTDEQCKTYPEWLRPHLDPLMPNVRRNSIVAHDLMGVNDQLNVHDSAREAKLVARFAELGIELEFTGEGEP